MPIATQVEAHHRLMYANSVTMVAQQMKDPFQGLVTDEQASGEAKSATDLYGAADYSYGEDRSRRNPESPIIGDRRWLIRPPVIEFGKYIDTEDQFDGATNPTSAFVTLGVAAVRRGKADRTLGVRKDDAGRFRVTEGGILGGAVSGKRPGGAPTALPGSQFVPVGATGLTIDKVRAAVLELQKNDFGVEDDDELYCFYSPKQKDDLLAIAQTSATALNAFAIDQLKTGKPTPLLGVTWVMSNRAPYKDGSTTIRLCPIWSKRNIVRGIWQDVKGDMWNDTSAKNKPYCYVSAYIDAVRLEDKGVMVIECQE